MKEALDLIQRLFSYYKKAVVIPAAIGVIRFFKLHPVHRIDCPVYRKVIVTKASTMAVCNWILLTGDFVRLCSFQY